MNYKVSLRANFLLLALVTKIAGSFSVYPILRDFGSEVSTYNLLSVAQPTSVLNSLMVPDFSLHLFFSPESTQKP